MRRCLEEGMRQSLHVVYSSHRGQENLSLVLVNTFFLNSNTGFGEFVTQTPSPKGDFLIFLQLQLCWNPWNPRDLRSNLPDLGLGRLIPPDGRLYIQEGADIRNLSCLWRLASLPCNYPQQLQGPWCICLSYKAGIWPGESCYQKWCCSSGWGDLMDHFHWSI